MNKLDNYRNFIQNYFKTYIDMRKIPYYIILLLTIIICIQYCTVKHEPNTITKPTFTEQEETIINYKDSIIYRDSVIVTYVSIKDSISQMNKNSLDKHYDKQMDTLNANKSDYRDTLIQGLVFEIEIADTLIENLTDKTILQDTIIHNLEIINETNRIYIEDVEDKLIKSEKKIKRKNIWIIISTSIATILTLITIAN